MFLFNTILSLLLLQFIFGRYNSGVLACGLFGGGFNRPIDETILYKLKLLGVFNQSRGEDSCGYYNGQDIFKGVDGNKKFCNLVINKGIEIPANTKNHIFMGHTRKSTFGAHTEANAHPFNINKNMVLTHNGKFTNNYRLSQKYGMTVSQYTVDSEAFGYILDKVGYKVLNEYEGDAALVVHKFDQPNVIYIYHGESKKVANGVLVEERPMFYMKTKEGVYYSSLEEALKFIKEEGDEISKLPCNMVFTIRKGELHKTKIIVDRGDSNVFVYNKTNNCDDDGWGVMGGTHSKCGKSYMAKNEEAIRKLTNKFNNIPILNSKKNGSFEFSNNGVVTNIEGLDISKELLPAEIQGEAPKNGKVFWWKGRYYIWKNKEKIVLADGTLSLTKAGEIIPIDDLSTCTERIDNYFFFKGIMLNSTGDYIKITSALEDSEKTPIKSLLESKYENWCSELSKYSKYAICLMNDEAPFLYDKQLRSWWYSNGAFMESSITPKFSSRNYHFKRGLLIRINGTLPNDLTIFSSTEKPKVQSELFKEEKTITSTLDSLENNEYNNVDVLELSKIEKKFKKCYASAKLLKEELGEAGMLALTFYAEELCLHRLKIQNPSDEKISSIIESLIREATEKFKPLYTFFDIDLTTYSQHILDALAQIAADEDKRFEESYNSYEQTPVLENDDDDDSPIDSSIVPKTIPLIAQSSYKDDLPFEEVTPHHEKDKDDDDGEEEIKNMALTTQDNDTAENLVDRAANHLEALQNIANELNTLDKSEFALESATEIERSLEDVVPKLKDLCSKMQFTAIATKLKRINFVC